MLCEGIVRNILNARKDLKNLAELFGPSRIIRSTTPCFSLTDNSRTYDRHMPVEGEQSRVYLSFARVLVLLYLCRIFRPTEERTWNPVLDSVKEDLLTPP